MAWYNEMVIDACAQCSSERLALLLGAAILYALVEYWLGKTDRTKSSSVVELVIAIAVLVVTVISNRLRRNKDG